MGVKKQWRKMGGKGLLVVCVSWWSFKVKPWWVFSEGGGEEVNQRGKVEVSYSSIYSQTCLPGRWLSGFPWYLVFVFVLTFTQECAHTHALHYHHQGGKLLLFMSGRVQNTEKPEGEIYASSQQSLLKTVWFSDDQEGCWRSLICPNLCLCNVAVTRASKE